MNLLNNNKILGNQSVSGFLNGAMNQIADDLIKGVDVDVNLKSVSDDPNAQRTDLNVSSLPAHIRDINYAKSTPVEISPKLEQLTKNMMS